MNKSILASRPAEISAGATTIALAIAKISGLNDPDIIFGIAMLIGGVPAAVTWVVELRRRNN